jgi:hypothetical protein
MHVDSLSSSLGHQHPAVCLSALLSSFASIPCTLVGRSRLLHWQRTHSQLPPSGRSNTMTTAPPATATTPSSTLVPLTSPATETTLHQVQTLCHLLKFSIDYPVLQMIDELLKLNVSPVGIVEVLKKLHNAKSKVS